MADEHNQTGDEWGAWRDRIKASQKRRDDLIATWQENVDARKGKVHTPGLDATTGRSATPSGVIVNQDWPLTKAKIAQLYSQTPEVRLTPRNEMVAAAVPAFGRELNATISDCSVGSTIEEVLADVVNASGIGAVMISCDKRTETVQMPMVDPMIAAMTGQPQEMMPVTRVADLKYLVERVSPADALVPTDFTGSNYNHARWGGRDGRMTWAQSMTTLGLTEDHKENVLGKDKRASGTSNTLSKDNNQFKDAEVVNFTEVFYWRHFYHADETNFSAIQHVVFVEGLDEPVINEPYQVQKRLEDGRIVGVKLLPIQFLTLTYISDDALPPSDSTVSRFQVDELEESRDQMVQQRRHSIPIRWYDTNRVSGGTKSLLEKGTYQGFIPTNGPGDRAVGEVSRASFPQEKFEFDGIIKSDITELWQVGTNQAGAFSQGERSAREAGIIEKNFQRRVGQEQDKVQKFFLNIAEVLAAHLAMYGTFDLPDELGPMRQEMANAFVYSVRVDSTVRLDAEQRIEQLTRFLNLTVQSGYVNPKPVIAEIAELSGLDPTTVVIDPQPKSPEPVKISIGSAEDIINPLMLAALARTNQLPGPADVQAVSALLASIGSIPGMAAMMIPPEAPTEGGPPGGVENPEVKHAGWEAAPRIERRDADGGA